MATLCFGSVGVAGDVEVRVQGLRNGNGVLRVAICGEESFLQARCGLGGRVAAAAGSVVMRDVPPGWYAVQAHHDENGNGRIDRGRLGRPVEGLGFSRDAPMRFGPPRYADAVVEVPARDVILNLTMRYFQ
jgi:uncharacterized protein (DUF2141 family)